jgi:hypothetical protein
MKIVNFVLGLAAAVILSALIILGIKTFYPEPVAPTYPNMPAAVVPCASNDTACITADDNAQQAQSDQFNQQEAVYEQQLSGYNLNVFIIANIIGIIVFAIGFWLVFGAALTSFAVPIGIMLAGLWSIMYGYARGWESVDNQLKFFIGLVIAVLVIGGSTWLMQRYQKKGGRGK